MKSETARREIESLDYYLQNHTNDYSEESHTAMMMAIDALEQEPCNDAISRQAVMEIFEYFMDYWKEHAIDVEPHEIKDALIEQYEFTAKQLSELPSVNITKTIQEKQAESEKYQKAFEDGYENGYAQARFDYEQEDVIEKIKAEIEEKCCITVGRENDPAITLHDVFEILDKHRVKSEGNDADSN